VFTVNGSGWDIWGTDDEFQYVYQPLTGDHSIVARVTSQTNTDPWAKAGVMIKQSTTPGSPYALMALTPGNGTVFQSGFNSSVTGPGYTLPNGWVRLDRAGNVFTAYVSADGTNWTQVGSTTIAMTSSETVGLFVCAHNGNVLGKVTFDNVKVT
jgi:regulation of enolase protein 1 (concanavalin A-like superfamily)